MKKWILILVAVLLAGGVFVFLIRRPPLPGDAVADTLLPGDTVAFLQIGDLPRTRLRWRETALYKIAHEPEVAAFLERPRSKIPRNAQADGALEKLRAIDAKEIFLAVTSLNEKVPKFIAGFDYKGRRGDASVLVAELKERVKSEFPSGRADIVKYGDVEIETFAANETTFGFAFKNRWLFVSDDLELLKSTLERLDGKSDGKGTLRENAAFKTAQGKMPRSADVFAFAQTQVFIERLLLLLSSSNLNVDAKQIEELKKIQAVAMATKLDGEKIRDAFFVLKPGGEKSPPMAMNSLAFTSPQTLFYYATAFQLGAAPRLPDPSLDTTGVLQALASLRLSLENQGLGFEDFKAAFGPEFGVVIDWTAGAMQPTPLLVLDVKDAARAQKFVEALTNGQAGFPAWARQDFDGTHFYSMPPGSAGLLPITPVLAVTDKAVLFGLDSDALRKTIQRIKSDEPHLDKGGDFIASENSVATPSAAFGYIDSKALFENVYGIGSNALKMMALFNPRIGDYADMSKLPPAETISKHLGPVVYSQSSDADGLLVESVGPVTFNQAVFGAAVGAGAAAIPMIKKQFTGQGAQVFPAPRSSRSAPSAPAATPAPTTP
jgi:hypothetical protein